MSSDATTQNTSTMSGEATTVPAAQANGGEDATANNQPGDGQRDSRSNRGNQKRRGRGGRRGGGGFGSSKHGGMLDKREQVHANRMSRREKVINEDGDGTSLASVAFSAEEIAAEDRKPKRKVAVMIGYAGTGYHGIQINHKDKTIEGDLFAAFVKTGAISKANADDPKKSSLVRCARTDKGVHAAANVLSLKLIIEDDNLVEKLNEALPEQIRVWGVQRTNNGFSCYQQCSSRWYEYLMPSYALLPPQPNSYLGKKIAESAKEKGVYDQYVERLGDVKNYWEEVEKNDIQPILEKLDPEVRAKVVDTLTGMSNQDLGGDDEMVPTAGEKQEENTESAVATTSNTTSTSTKRKAEGDGDLEAPAPKVSKTEDSTEGAQVEMDTPTPSEATPHAGSDSIPAQPPKPQKELSPAEKAIREIKAAYIAAKRRFRVSAERVEKLQEALTLYQGTHIFHNYTINKTFTDPSSQRHIKSFVVNPKPIQIGDTEWLSIKVHGQSFMMHQIRKMIAMAVMVTRCGAPTEIITESYGPRRISIPKAPGLGLMLERPMFDEYNKKAASEYKRDPVDFAKYDDQIQAFKDKEIYRRMFEAEEKENAFHIFFHQLDNFKTDYFLWVTAGGLESAYERSNRSGEKIPKALQEESGDDADGVEEEAN